MNPGVSHQADGCGRFLELDAKPRRHGADKLHRVAELRQVGIGTDERGRQNIGSPARFRCVEAVAGHDVGYDVGGLAQIHLSGRRQVQRCGEGCKDLIRIESGLREEPHRVRRLAGGKLGRGTQQFGLIFKALELLLGRTRQGLYPVHPGFEIGRRLEDSNPHGEDRSGQSGGDFFPCGDGGLAHLPHGLPHPGHRGDHIARRHLKFSVKLLRTAFGLRQPPFKVGVIRFELELCGA